MKRILVIGPSDTKTHGGMAAVTSVIRKSEYLNERYKIDFWESYVDGNRVVRLWFSFRQYIRFLHLKKHYDVYHIHVASYGSTFRKILYMKHILKSSRNVIIHLHGAEYLNFYQKLRKCGRKVIKAFFDNAKVVLVLSDYWKRALDEKIGVESNCYVLRNCALSENMICPSRNDFSHEMVFLFLGRIGTRKGTFDLIRAFEYALKENDRIRLIIAGDGREKEARDLIERHHLNQYVKIVGWVEQDKKEELLRCSQVIVLPSYNEGLPVALLEGMAAGKAIISTPVGSIPELIEEENGILVPPGNIEKLSAAIVKLSSNPQIAYDMGKQNFKCIKNRYSKQRFEQTLADFYDLCAH